MALISRVPVFQPSGLGLIPGRVKNFNFYPGTRVCPLCSVLCCPWEWPWHSADHIFQGGPSLCICLVFLSTVCASLCQHQVSPSPFIIIPQTTHLHYKTVTHTSHTNLTCFRYTTQMSTPVVQWLSYSPLNPRSVGLNLAGVDGFFSERKNPEYDFLQKGSRAVGPVS